MSSRVIDYIHAAACSNWVHWDGPAKHEMSHRAWRISVVVVQPPRVSCAVEVQIVEVAMSTSPQVLDKYELLERIGPGEIVETWKAFDTQQKRHVAIKILPVNLQATPHSPTRFIPHPHPLPPLSPP